MEITETMKKNPFTASSRVKNILPEVGVSLVKTVIKKCKTEDLQQGATTGNTQEQGK